MGSPTITKEEDQLLGAEEVTTDEVAARPPPPPIQDPLGDAAPNDKPTGNNFTRSHSPGTAPVVAPH